MALDPRVMKLVSQAKGKYSGMSNKAKAKAKGDAWEASINERRNRRNRRNIAICSYRVDEWDDTEAIDIARDEMDFIQRIEAYTGEDMWRFAEIVGTYLAGAPAGDQERFAGNLLRLHEVVARGVLRRKILEGLDGLL